KIVVKEITKTQQKIDEQPIIKDVKEEDDHADEDVDSDDDEDDKDGDITTVGFAPAISSNTVDVIMDRVMNTKVVEGFEQPYKGAIDCVVSIVDAEVPMALYNQVPHGLLIKPISSVLPFRYTYYVVIVEKWGFARTDSDGTAKLKT
ncbi:hypothetical protein Tco_1426939, partial [Tanacetum coccineum]